MGHGENWKDRLLWSLGGAAVALVVMAAAGALTHVLVKDPEATAAGLVAQDRADAGLTTTTPTTPTTGKGSRKELTTTTGSTTTGSGGTTTTTPGASTGGGGGGANTTSTIPGLPEGVPNSVCPPGLSASQCAALIPPGAGATTTTGK